MSMLMLRPVLASNPRFEVNSAEHGHYQLRPGGIVPGLHLGDIVDDDDVDVYVVDDDDDAYSIDEDDGDDNNFGGVGDNHGGMKSFSQ